VTGSRETRRAWIAWIAICVIWGTTYLAIKIALGTIPPLLTGGLRYLAAAAIMIILLKVQGRPLPPLSVWPAQALIGFAMLGLGNGGVVIAEQHLTSGLTAVLVGTSPFWMVGIDAMFRDGKRLRLQQLAGMTVGFIGIVMLVWPDLALAAHAAELGHAAALGTTPPSRSGVIIGIVAVQIACMGWAVASSYSKRHHSTDVMGMATLQMMFGGMLMTLVATVLGDWSRVSFTPSTTGALAYLAVLGSVVAFVSYSYALKHLPISIVSLYTYVNPVIAVALGALLLHEPFGLRQIAAASVIALGMVIVRPSKQPEGEVS
jgi:drug/metabolite transporter (DMT)-like permease